MPQSGQAGSLGDLGGYVRNKLPHYMVPSAFMVLERLPLSTSGKLDRRRLPPPGKLRPHMGTPFADPANYYEMELAHLWKQMLGIPRVGANDNFFERGGYSLLAARLFAEIEKRYGRKFPLRVLFEAPTVRQLAALFREQDWRPHRGSVVGIQPVGSRPPLFYFPPANAVLGFYRTALYWDLTSPSMGCWLHPMETAIHSCELRRKQRIMSRRFAPFNRRDRIIWPVFPMGVPSRLKLLADLEAQNQNVALLAVLDTRLSERVQRKGAKYYLYNLRSLVNTLRVRYFEAHALAHAKLVARRSRQSQAESAGAAHRVTLPHRTMICAPM